LRLENKKLFTAAESLRRGSDILAANECRLRDIATMRAGDAAADLGLAAARCSDEHLDAVHLKNRHGKYTKSTQSLTGTETAARSGRSTQVRLHSVVMESCKEPYPTAVPFMEIPSGLDA